MVFTQLGEDETYNNQGTGCKWVSIQSNQSGGTVSLKCGLTPNVGDTTRPYSGP